MSGQTHWPGGLTQRTLPIIIRTECPAVSSQAPMLTVCVGVSDDRERNQATYPNGSRIESDPPRLPLRWAAKVATVSGSFDTEEFVADDRNDDRIR